MPSYEADVRGSYDVVVVGGGHAGAEAAAAAARAGVRTLLLTPDLSRIGQMSCNPAIGGVAKGIVAREVDALGGVMGRATDAARIQFRMLNRSKGPAVWGPRAQCDRALYPLAVRRVLEGLPGLDLFQEMVHGLVVEDGAVRGVRTRGGMTFGARAVVVTTGTFLRGRIHVGGEAGVEAGRAGEAPSVALAEGLEGLGLEVARFKTGTPPRVDGRTVDFARVERQDGDPDAYRFSAYQRGHSRTETVLGDMGRRIRAEGRRESETSAERPLRRRDLGPGPAVLPVDRGQGRPLPAGGASSGLPRARGARDHGALRERALHVASRGSAAGVPPHRARARGRGDDEDRLRDRVRLLPAAPAEAHARAQGGSGALLRRQINGTTGYEEAAGQGVVAGINAALAVRGEDPWIFGRDEAYLGVLIDDLVTRGVDEPYRLFTSRAEFRLLLRQDNAPRRLGREAQRRGLLTAAQAEALRERLREEDRVVAWFRGTSLHPARVRGVLDESGSAGLSEPTRAVDLLKRPRVRARALLEASGGEELGHVSDESLAAVEVELKYEGYVARERERAARLREQAAFRLAEELPYGDFVTISHEAREKLARVRPATLAQAGRIPGVSPADLQNLILEVRRLGRLESASGA
jgi:tRNA uridine 5-carboxymethylaminomethyl modification enzyme